MLSYISNAIGELQFQATMDNQINSSERSEQFVLEVIASQRRLYAYILTLIPDFNEANDVLQQTNMSLWRNADRFELGTSFIAWACRVAYYAVLEHREKIHRTRARFSDVLLDCLSHESESLIENEDVRLKALTKCLKEMPKHWSDLIQRRYVKEEMIKSIASSMGKTTDAISSRLFRIREMLWKCIRRRMKLEEAT